MVLFITYLCPSQLQKKRKKNKAKSTKQTLSRLSQTGRNQFCVSEQFSIRSQHFLNFSSKTSLPIQATNFSREILRNPPPKNSSKVHRDEGKNGRRNTTTTTKKNTNVIIIVYAASLNFFLISFVYKRECLPNRTRGMTTMNFVFFRTHFFFFLKTFLDI